MDMPEWLLQEGFLVGLGVFSVVAFVGSLVMVPVLVSRMSQDYFCRGERPLFAEGDHPVIRGVLLLVKNVIGLVLLFAGFLMLFLPGQGILTMILGLALLDIPGKYQLERRLIKKPQINKPLNWMRRKAGKPDFLLPEDD